MTRHQPCYAFRAGPSSDQVFSLYLFLCFVVVSMLTYRHIVGGWFVADDFRWLEISNLPSTIGSFGGSWGHGAAYRPLPRLTYLLDFWLFGFWYPGWILTNVVLHSLNALLLYRLMRFYFDTRLEQLCLPLLFCISPLGHENVAWISGRTHVLCAGFVLLSMSACLSYLATARPRYLLWSLATFFFALLSYEAAIYEIPLLALAVWLRSRKDKGVPAGLVGLGLAFGGVLVGYLALRTIALHPAPVEFYPERELVWTRVVEHLGSIYRIVGPLSGLGLPVVGAFLLGCAFWPWRTLRLAAVAVVVFMVGMMPFSTLPTLSYRFFYIAQVGLMLLLASTVCACLLSQRRVPKALGAILLLGVVLVSISRVDSFARDWVSSGAVTRSVGAQIRAMYPEQPDRMNFYVYGAPVAYSSVPMFISYFDSTVRFVYGHYREFHGVVLNSWELSSKPHLVNSLRGQVVHTGAECPSADMVLSPEFARLQLREIQGIALACPAKYFEFDRATLRVLETSKQRWVELVTARPGMSFLP